MGLLPGAPDIRGHLNNDEGWIRYEDALLKEREREGGWVKMIQPSLAY